MTYFHAICLCNIVVPQRMPYVCVGSVHICVYTQFVLYEMLCTLLSICFHLLRVYPENDRFVFHLHNCLIQSRSCKCRCLCMRFAYTYIYILICQLLSLLFLFFRATTSLYAASPLALWDSQKSALASRALICVCNCLFGRIGTAGGVKPGNPKAGFTITCEPLTRFIDLLYLLLTIACCLR